MTSDLRDFGAAIIGTGFMGWVHAEALARIGVPVVSVLGSRVEKAERLARRSSLSGRCRIHADLDEVLSDPSVSVVHLTVPNRWHFDFARRALLAGKHVMCEKPLAMTTAESGELVSLANAHPRLVAGVNYNIRFYPLCREMRDRVHSGELGDVLHVCGSYSQDWLLHNTDYNWRVLSGEGGELRAMSDIGTHWLDLAQEITGLKVESLCADLKTVHPIRYRPEGEIETFQGSAHQDQRRSGVPITTDDYGCLLLRFEGGTSGVVWASQVMAGHKNQLRLEIAGSRRSLAWNSESPDQLWIGRRDEPNELLSRDPSLLGRAGRQSSDYPGGHVEGYADSFKQCFRAFYGYLAAGDFAAPRPFATFADGHREIMLCEAILRSHQSGSWVTVADQAAH